MNRHDAAFALVGFTAACIIFGAPPCSPIWVRWVGLALAIPAIILFIITAPRSER